jgi:hypothetical protein
MSEPKNAGNIQETRNPDGTFKPGVSGNPAGKRPGTRSFTTKVREALEKIADGKDYTYEEAFIKAILKKGIVDQDTGIMRTIWEQLDGKPLQKTEHSGEISVGKPLLGGQSNDSNNSDQETTSTQEEN